MKAGAGVLESVKKADCLRDCFLTQCGVGHTNLHALVATRAFHDGLGDLATAKNPRLNPQAVRDVGHKGGRRRWVLDPNAHGHIQFATTFMPSL